MSIHIPKRKANAVPFTKFRLLRLVISAFVLLVGCAWMALFQRYGLHDPNKLKGPATQVLPADSVGVSLSSPVATGPSEDIPARVIDSVPPTGQLLVLLPSRPSEGLLHALDRAQKVRGLKMLLLIHAADHDFVSDVLGDAASSAMTVCDGVDPSTSILVGTSDAVAFGTTAAMVLLQGPDVAQSFRNAWFQYWKQANNKDAGCL